jgi:hypothetical protein
MSMLGPIPDLPPNVLDALSRGERSEAITLLQSAQNLSREDAREQVATYIMSQPGLGRRMKDSQPSTPWGLLRWLFLAQAIAVAIGYLLLFKE